MAWEEKIREGFLPMRAWKRDGCPEVGYWMWTGEVDLAREVDIDCKSDWVPHGLNLHNRRLGEYNTFQITAQGYKELVHRQLYQDLAGMQLPQRWKSTMRREPAGHPNKGTQAAAQIKRSPELRLRLS